MMRAVLYVTLCAGLLSAGASLAQPAAPPNGGLTVLRDDQGNTVVRQRIEGPSPALRAGLNAALGLPTDARPQIQCRMMAGSPGPECGYSVDGGPRTEISPELMAQLTGAGLLPLPPGVLPPAPPAPPQLGKPVEASPLTNSVRREGATR